MKYTLAIEASTSTQSIALLGDNCLLGETSWQASRGASENVFTATNALLQANNVTLNDINLFGIGLGPGNFTGLRTTLSAIQAMALPTHADIIGVSSAEAIAYQFESSDLRFKNTESGNQNCSVGRPRPINEPQPPAPSSQHPAPSHRILAVGDARRSRLWVGVFETTQDHLQQTGSFELVAIEDFAEQIIAEDTIITPDWESLKEELSSIVPETATLIESSQIPSASSVAILANRRKAGNIPSEELKPIYMHPPVFIEPRFTEATKRKH